MADAGATRRVLQELRKRVLRGDLLPGEQLRQEQLALELDVSRVPIREALMVLANQGLLTHHPNQGFVVTKRTADELDQVNRLLDLLENELLNTFRWPDRSTLMKLKNINTRMSRLVDADDWTDVVPLNHEFHKILWTLSSSTLIAQETERVWGLADAYISEGYRSTANRAGAVADHERIIEAVQARDIDRLRAEHQAHREASHANATQRLAKT
ncbi:MAG: GntR family transcriptional regulator [Actinomycetales bacterium]|nr:MAG: GntR family transcriptional regulator [Actinomycetales bacterium]